MCSLEKKKCIVDSSILYTDGESKSAADMIWYFTIDASPLTRPPSCASGEKEEKRQRKDEKKPSIMGIGEILEMVA